MVQYPNVDAEGNQYEGNTPQVAQEQVPDPAPEQPAVPENTMKVKLPSGYEVDLSPEQVGETYVANKNLQEKAGYYDAFTEWSNRNPEGAAQVTKIINGQPVEVPQVNSTPPSPTLEVDDLFGEMDDPDPSSMKPVMDRLDALGNQVQSLSGELEGYRNKERERADQEMLNHVQSNLQSALDEHPYTKGSDEQTRNAIAELALIDSRRYQHEGVTHEMAVTKWANHFESVRRNELAGQVESADNRPAVPPPPGPGAVIPQPPPPAPSALPGGFFDSGKFGAGLRTALNETRGVQ